MVMFNDTNSQIYVTTHTGGVDWNIIINNQAKADEVTTHTGGVDWNHMQKKMKQNH